MNKICIKESDEGEARKKEAKKDRNMMVVANVGKSKRWYVCLTDVIRFSSEIHMLQIYDCYILASHSPIPVCL